MGVAGVAWATFICQGIMVGLLTLASYSIGQYFSNHEYAMTMAFITMSGAELCHAFNVKSHHSVFNKQVFNNKYLWGATAIGLVLQLVIIFTPLSIISSSVSVLLLHFVQSLHFFVSITGSFVY